MCAYIKLENICYKYKKGDFELKDVSLSMDEGRIYCITGKNGCGKTTLGKIIAGIFKPQSGKYFLCGKDTADMQLYEFGSKIGYLFQNPSKQLFAQSVKEEITFALSLKGVGDEKCREICAEMIEKFDLKKIADAPTLNLSRGEKQRLALAAIFADGARFIMLDEPTTALDKVRREDFYAMLNRLKAEGIGAAVITHDSALVEGCADVVFQMDGGRLL